MAKEKKIWCEGACYHIMGRGNRRCSIFRSEEDYALFLRILGEIRSRYSFILHAFCILSDDKSFLLGADDIAASNMEDYAASDELLESWCLKVVPDPFIAL